MLSNTLKKSAVLFVVILLLVSVEIVDLVGGQKPISQGAVYVGPQMQGFKITHLNPNSTLTITIYIPPKNLNMLYLIAQEVSNHQIKPLNRTELINMFGNVQKEKEIVSYLQSKGFVVVYESPFAVMALAPVWLIESTFNVNLYLYEFNNETYYRPALTDGELYNVPSIFNGTIIGGLTNFTEPQYQHVVLGKLIDGNLQLKYGSDITPLQAAFTYYSPGDIEGAYNITPLLNAIRSHNPVSIAVIDAYGDPLIYEDLQTFDTVFHLPPANLTIVPIGPYHPLGGIFTGWDVETALDVETVHLADPYAHIYLVVASNPSALYLAVDYVVTEDLAQIVSMSWGAPENLFGASGFFVYFNGESFPNYPFLNYYFQLGNAEGITFFAAAGDEGAYGGTTTSYGGVLFPASSPFVTAVGGTSLFVNVTSGYLSSLNSTGTYEYETAWSVDPFYFGIVEGTVSSGGGYSTFFPVPPYQSMISSTVRVVPDVAANANPYTGPVIYVLGQEEIVGGTSAATPLWAGILGDIESYLNITSGLGNINPILYWIYSNSSLYKEAFHEVTLGYNGVYLAKPGYNLVTGLGSPNAYGLALAFEDYMKYYADRSLRISVTTEQPGNQYPWYMYGSTFEIVAYITYPNGSLVTNGSFYATISTTEGQFPASYTLTFNGTYWVTNVTVTPGSPPNIWTIEVQGSSQSGLSGNGIAEVDIGESIGIIEPVPFPYAASIIYNEPFNIVVTVYYPNGTPVVNQSVFAYLIKDGKLYANLTLLMIRPGEYATAYALLPPMPQGTYLLEIISDYGEAYTYVYFGDMIYGGVISPVNDYLPSASPGQNITVFAEVLTPEITGLFTSKVVASLQDLNGTTILNVTLHPAPNVVLFGIYDLFFTYYNNITIPSGIKPGFYNIIISSETNTSLGPAVGKFVTAIYISNYSLNVNVRIDPTLAYEGQLVKIYANITYPNGSEVTSGSFTATLVPSSLGYAVGILGFNIGVPLQYNSSIGEWVGVFRVPSELNGSIFQGDTANMLSGPWSIFVSGVASNGDLLFSNATYLIVSPLTYIGNNIVLNSKDITSIPFMVRLNQTTYLISEVYAPNLTINGLNVEIVNARINSLTLNNAKAVIIDSTIGGTKIAITSINSTVSLVNSLIVNSVYGFDQVNSNISMSGVKLLNVTALSIVPPPVATINIQNVTTSSASLQVNVTGVGLRVINVVMNGKPVTYSISAVSPNNIIITIPFNSSALPDGEYSFTIEVSNGGLVYNLTKTVFNSYHQVYDSEQLSTLSNDINSLTTSVSSLSTSVSSLNTSVNVLHSALSSTNTIAYSSLAISIIALILGIVGILLSIRKGGGSK